MDDDIQTGGESDEGESLSDTIAAALEDQEGDALISDLGDAETAAGETQETEGQAVTDNEGGVETPGDGDAGQTDEGAPEPDQDQEEAAPEPESEPDTVTADQYRQLGEIYRDTVAPF